MNLPGSLQAGLDKLPSQLLKGNYPAGVWLLFISDKQLGELATVMDLPLYPPPPFPPKNHLSTLNGIFYVVPPRLKGPSSFSLLVPKKDCIRGASRLLYGRVSLWGWASDPQASSSNLGMVSAVHAVIRCKHQAGAGGNFG